MAGSGFWRNRYKYQESTVATDGAGQATMTWADVVTIAGNVTATQREVLDDMGVAVRTDVTFETPFHPGIKAQGRLVDVANNAVYNILGVVDPEGGKRRRLRITGAAIDAPGPYGTPEPA